ncbi:hypothetical protein BD289DRAFT_176949 [Coniella lustricola]|uniref:Secreted protein n=1 Tax=Coniella lustricola TaxID=2025994 RepID=A0A2T2ZTJ7_9PEZI|nr:hypothetical protein BD289DRAFT_176949 [Coniella lustricola]
MKVVNFSLLISLTVGGQAGTNLSHFTTYMSVRASAHISIIYICTCALRRGGGFSGPAGWLAGWLAGWGNMGLAGVENITLSPFPLPLPLPLAFLSSLRKVLFPLERNPWWKGGGRAKHRRRAESRKVE